MFYATVPTNSSVIPQRPAPSGTVQVNDSAVDINFDYPLEYRIFATVIHVTIFVLGVTGNIVLILVARRTRNLQTPTYCYLVSLAYADLLVLFSAVPEAIVFHHIGKRWLFGQVACSLFIFINFLGINAGSVSILAFTVERYIAIVSSPLTHKFCTIERTKKIIFGLWIMAICYCCPWLALTEVKPDLQFSKHEQCDFRFSPSDYMYFFAADFTLFYVIPLVIAAYVYTKIGLVLCKSSRLFLDNSPVSSIRHPDQQLDAALLPEENSEKRRQLSGGLEKGITARSAWIMQSRVQVLPMLIVTVVLFAVTWIPFRGLLIYNSLVDVPFLDMWYLLFAKTIIYLNSAMNPFLYNAMSRRFRVAVHRMLSMKSRRKRIRRSKRSPGSGSAGKRPAELIACSLSKMQQFNT